MGSVSRWSGRIYTVFETIGRKTFDDLIPGTKSVEIPEILSKHPSGYLSCWYSCWIGSRSRSWSWGKSRTGICSRRSDTDSVIVRIESFEESTCSTGTNDIGKSSIERAITRESCGSCWKYKSESIDESYEERRKSEKKKKFKGGIIEE